MNCCDNKSTCPKFMRRGNAACESCDLNGTVEAPPPEPQPSTEPQPYESSEEEDGEETYDDEHGNTGRHLYNVELIYTDTVYSSATCIIAADDEDEARDRAHEIEGDLGIDEYERENDSVDIGSIENVDPDD